jgi:probable O-glycosylation ligase (exosortase A-associated)
MRDILLALVIVMLWIKTLRRAEFGAYLWAWLSLMNPHKLTFGFAYSVPWALTTALVTLVSMLFSKSRQPLPRSGGVVALLMLWGWMTITSMTSINPPEMVWERWVVMSKIYLMLLVTLMLLRGRKQIETLVWVVIVSIGYFGFKGGIFTVLTGGGYRVYGPPGSGLEENNSLAVALIALLPLMYYLRHVASQRWLRYFLTFAMACLGFAILGSQSRGALLGGAVMAFMLGLKSKYPVRFSIALVAVITIGVSFMPDSWTERMNTIREYDSEGSAMSRIYTWTTLWNVAVDRPLVGAGFRADTTELFARYAPTGERFASFQGSSWVAHSIYLQALGEHGFVGLILYVWIWVWLWFTAGRTAKQAERLPELKTWVPMLMRMCQVSTVGFCVGGAFLSLMTADLPYYVLCFVILCQCAVRDQLRQAKTSPDTVGQGVGGNPLPSPKGSI